MAGNGKTHVLRTNESAYTRNTGHIEVKVTHRSFGKDLKDMPGVRKDDTANSKVLSLHM